MPGKMLHISWVLTCRVLTICLCFGASWVIGAYLHHRGFRCIFLNVDWVPRCLYRSGHIRPVLPSPPACGVCVCASVPAHPLIFARM